MVRLFGKVMAWGTLIPTVVPSSSLNFRRPAAIGAERFVLVERVSVWPRALMLPPAATLIVLLIVAAVPRFEVSEAPLATFTTFAATRAPAELKIRLPAFTSIPPVKVLAALLNTKA